MGSVVPEPCWLRCSVGQTWCAGLSRGHGSAGAAVLSALAQLLTPCCCCQEGHQWELLQGKMGWFCFVHVPKRRCFTRSRGSEAFSLFRACLCNILKHLSNNEFWREDIFLAWEWHLAKFSCHAKRLFSTFSLRSTALCSELLHVEAFASYPVASLRSSCVSAQPCEDQTAYSNAVKAPMQSCPSSCPLKVHLLAASPCCSILPVIVSFVLFQILAAEIYLAACYLLTL